MNRRVFFRPLLHSSSTMMTKDHRSLNAFFTLAFLYVFLCLFLRA